MATKAATKQSGKNVVTKQASKKAPRAGAAARKPVAKAEPLTHRLDALLHTMRCIAQHEDQLCSLLHDARKTGRVTATLRRDLSAILAELPAEEYTADLHAVLEITTP